MFVYYRAFKADWAEDKNIWLPRPPEGKILGVGDLVAATLETFDFSAALSLSEAGASHMHVAMSLVGLDGRKLWVDMRNRMPFMEVFECKTDTFDLSDDFQRETLVSAVEEQAEKWAREVLARFKWEPAEEVMDGIVRSYR